jgi:hypothetical protein
MILGFSLVVSAQANPQTETLVINGNAGEAKILQVNGHEYVDIRDLARLTNGSLSFRGNRVILTLPASSSGSSTNPPANPAKGTGLSKEFMQAGIEAMAAMREWGSTLATLMRNGYPVGDEMRSYRGRSHDSLTLAAAAATTSSDQSALQLLSNEFSNVSTWSDNLVNARNSADAANYAVSDDALSNDPLFQKISQCGRFLGPMLASGTFEDNNACH